MKNTVIIIGAGVTGLSAAYKLLKAGYSVKVIESGPETGGLAGTFTLEGKPVDRYYHFVCREDKALIDLSVELGLAGKLHWREAGTACYIGSRIHPFNTPVDLLRFSPVPFSQRIRLGIHALISQHRKRWKNLDQVPAKEWLIKHIGYDAYMAIWDPLLRIKFGAAHEKISAAWIWHRIHRVATSRERLMAGNVYGFFDQGCYTFLEGLVSAVSEFEESQIITSAKVIRIEAEDGKVSGVTLESGETIAADAIISTLAVNDFLEITPAMAEYSHGLKQIDYINVVCLVLHLKRPFTEHFWLNVNDPDISFNGIVEVTNLNPRPDMVDCHLAYIPFYVSDEDPHWRAADDSIFQECVNAMTKIDPEFHEGLIKDWLVFRDRNAQALCTVGFLSITPEFETPIKGLYMTDSSQYYPEDRNLSASVLLADNVVKCVDDALRG